MQQRLLDLRPSPSLSTTSASHVTRLVLILRSVSRKTCCSCGGAVARAVAVSVTVMVDEPPSARLVLVPVPPEEESLVAADAGAGVAATAAADDGSRGAMIGVLNLADRCTYCRL